MILREGKPLSNGLVRITGEYRLPWPDPNFAAYGRGSKDNGEPFVATVKTNDRGLARFANLAAGE
jgi:hypothetical protein